MVKADVLVVEDQEDFLELLKLTLEVEGYQVAAAPDGAQALKLLQLLRPAVIVTDLMMPNINGIELIQYVRSAPQLKDIPIIAASAARSGSLQEAKAAGATAVLQKPLDFDELIKLVNGCVSL